ncbi:hypothetical protein [Bradyrhizobium ivorense]|nr:hypothetical protein [Bradyrhizobium ivorense]VIO71644.1 hypothetical protein CI41S_30080 [Bradyrhizobium ivorense]
MRRCGWQGQHVGEPIMWIDIVKLGGLCRVLNYAEWLVFPKFTVSGV